MTTDDSTPKHTCELCGEPMAESESMFKYHGFSGPCPKPILKNATPKPTDEFDERPASARVAKLNVGVYGSKDIFIEGARWQHSQDLKCLEDMRADIAERTQRELNLRSDWLEARESLKVFWVEIAELKDFISADEDAKLELCKRINELEAKLKTEQARSTGLVEALDRITRPSCCGVITAPHKIAYKALEKYKSTEVEK